MHISVKFGVSSTNISGNNDIIVTKYNKIFHVLIVSETLSKYVLDQVHDMLGHNGTARTYQYLKLV